jgi:excisionase family DNA binding protein
MPTTYLTTQQIADRAGVDRRTVINWIADGDLKPAMKMPGATGMYLFTEKDVDRLLAERVA